MKDIYELLNEVTLDEDEFVEIEATDLEKKKVKNKFKTVVRKKTNKRRKVAIAASLVIALPLVFGIAFPTYAEKLPLLGDIFKYFKNDVSKVYEKYEEYSTEINMTKESNGIKITIQDALFDGRTLYYTYTIESDKELGWYPVLGIHSPIEVSEDNKVLKHKDSNIKKESENTYIGYDIYILGDYFDGYTKDSIDFNIKWKDIAVVKGDTVSYGKSVKGDEVEIDGDFKEIVKGEWNFDISLNAIDNTVKEINETVENHRYSLTIDDAIISPMSFNINYNYSKIGSAEKGWSLHDVTLDVKDDLGNSYIYEGQGAAGTNRRLWTGATIERVNEKATELIVTPKFIETKWGGDEKREIVLEPVIINLK